jgi:hypothetical protein
MISPYVDFERHILMISTCENPRQTLMQPKPPNTHVGNNVMLPKRRFLPLPNEDFGRRNKR